jgi:hypothetical protein
MSYSQYRIISGGQSLNFGAKNTSEAIKEARKKFKKFKLYSKTYRDFPLPDEGSAILHLVYDNTVPWWRKIWNVCF